MQFFTYLQLSVIRLPAMSHVICQLPCHMSYMSTAMSCVTSHISPITCHMLYVTCHVTCYHIGHVKCHMSCLQEIISEGCVLVPKSEWENEQLWRYSFSLAEVKLINSIPKPTMQVLLAIKVGVSPRGWK